MNLGKQLHKLGAWAYTHPWRVVTFWLVFLAVLALAAGTFYKAPSSDISIPGTQAQEAIDRVGELFPKGGGASGRIVFHAKNGEISQYEPEINALVERVATVDGVAMAVSPFRDPSFVSDDKTIAYSQVQLDKQTGSISDKTLESVEKIIGESRSTGLQIEAGGDLVSQTPGQIIGPNELVGIAIALLVLVITLGSLIAGGMPIISALVAVGVSMGGLFALSHVLDINSTTPVLAVMLGLAVGIDYSLFIVNKHRTLALRNYHLQDAAARALGTAGNAVVFAAITVIIALSALSVVNIPFMTTMGLVGAASIAVAALVALTLTPALLGIAKARIFSKKQRALIKQQTKPTEKISHSTFWYHLGERITKRPIVSLVIAVLIIGVIALPTRDLTLGLPTDQYAAKDTTERKAYDLLAEGFGVGFNAPLTVVVENLPKVSDADKQTVRSAGLAELEKRTAEATATAQAEFAEQARQASTPEQLAQLQQAAATAQAEGQAQQQAALAEIEKNVSQYAKYVQLNAVAENVAKLDGVQKVQPALVTDDGTAGILQVIPTTAPASDKTSQLISTLRNTSTAEKLAGDTNATLAVTGAVALQDDINEKLTHALPVYVAVIVGLSLVLLVIAFRSILVPLKATLGFVLSVLAMFGATVAVFQWGWFGITDEIGPIISFVPIIATGILFGLAMDYEFFLVSGMHESYQHTKNAKRSVVDGFGAGSKVVTAAAIIMVSVFAGFIASHETVIRSIGFALAVGILVDAFLVRMLLVPAVMTLLGRSAWWLPGWLNKRLPHVSIEGESEGK